MSYTPHAGSVATRLCAYLQANPDAKLTPTEVGEQFGCKPGDLTALLSSAINARCIKATLVEFGGAKTRIFSAGPELADLVLPTGPAAPAVQTSAPTPAPTPAPAPQPTKAPEGFATLPPGVPTGYVPRLTPPAAPAPTPFVAAPAPVAATPKGTKGGPGSLPELTLDMIKVHKHGLPKPHRISSAGIRTELLKSLEVGQAIEFPVIYKGTLCNAAQKLAKATGRKFSASNLNKDKAAIWRDK